MVALRASAALRYRRRLAAVRRVPRRHDPPQLKMIEVVCDVSCRGESGDIWADMAGYDRISGIPADTV